MKFNRITCNLLQAGIVSLAGVALLTQTASAGEMKKMGNVEDLQGVVACNVTQNPWLAVAPLGELPCELPVGGRIEAIAIGLEQEIFQLDDATKAEIVYIRHRHEHPNALVVGDR